jgi:hypothetical protein
MPLSADGTTQPLHFANGNVANLIATSSPDQAEAVLDSLAVRPCDFILLLLGAAPESPALADPALEQFAGPLLALLAGLGRTVVLDTGTRNWLTAPIHQKKVEKAPQTEFLGVAPEALVAYPGAPDQPAAEEVPRQLSSCHTNVVLVAAEERWGGQLPMTHALAKALAARSEYVPVLALLVGDGLCAAEETLAAVRNGIPLAVLRGGHLADDIANALQPGNPEPSNELLDELVAEGQISVLAPGSFAADLSQVIGQMHTPDAVLTQAWENFAAYDLNANYQQRQSNRINYSIIALGVVGTVLAVVQQVRYPGSQVPFNLHPSNLTQETVWPWLLHYALLLLPIGLTILIAAAYKFKISSKWFVLRAGAEALRSEIYAYRARAVDYQRQARQQLAARMAEIVKRTMQSEANGSYLREYEKAAGFPPYLGAAGGADTGFGYLSPDQYVELRLEDQLRYFRRLTRRLDRQFRLLYWLTLGIGGISTLMAALSQQIWIAVTASLTAALGTLLSYRQTESNLLKYNQAAADLDNVKSWWKALPAAERARQSNIDTLVDRTEKVLQTELDGWVQQMRNAMADVSKTYDASAEAAQKWRPVVQFARVQAVAPPMPTPAPRTVVRPTPEQPEPELLKSELPEPELPEPAETSATPALRPEPALAASLASAAAAPAPDLAIPLAKANGAATGPAPRKPKPHWETNEITPEVLRRAIESKHTWFDDKLNIIGIRATSYVDNTFGDRLFCCWKQRSFPPDSTLKAKQEFLAAWGYRGAKGEPIVADGQEGPNTSFALEQLAKDVDQYRLMGWPVTTRPGTSWLTSKMKAGGCAVLKPDQYKDAYVIGLHQGNPKHPALRQNGSLTIYRDNNRNSVAEEKGKIEKGIFGINIHHANEDSKFVGDWSAGCQVFKRIVEHKAFMNICRQSGQKKFTYTLLHEADLA